MALHGDRFLHGWLCSDFADSQYDTLQLCARARQFSSFVLLVGSIASAEEFVPKFGIIIQVSDAFVHAHVHTYLLQLR